MTESKKNSPMPAQETQLSRFWYELAKALTKRGVPMCRRTDRAADFGWGRGCRIIIDSDDRIGYPNGKTAPFSSVNVEEFADACRAAYRLTRRERQVLNALREGAATYRYRTQKTAKVGDMTVRESTLDRLCSLGLVEELVYGSDLEYVAVQPQSVGSLPPTNSRGHTLIEVFAREKE